MTQKFDMTIGGNSVATASYKEIVDPATEEPVGLAAQATAEELDAAVAAAGKAFGGWRHASNEDRKLACHKMADIIEANAEELAVLNTRETGKSLQGLGSRFEVGGCVAWIRFSAEQELPVKMLEDSENGRIEQHRVPVGVVGSITPWNWPLMIAIWHIVPAIRTGNTVVSKPSPYSPLGTLRMIELMSEAVPPGVLNVISGEDALGALMSQHAGINKIVFTGSINTGKKVMASAAPTLKRLTLELGGNDPGIVLADASPSAIAEKIFWGAFINSGQTCAALKRLYVPDHLYDEMCDALVEVSQSVTVGNGLDEGTGLGPLQNRQQYERVIELVDDAKTGNARILTGGKAPGGPGYFYPVTLVADIADGTRLVDEEQFGPVLPIIRYSDLDDAVRRANGTEFGLSASVWGSDQQAAARVAAQLDAGTVWINKHAEISPHVPMGGVKSSGLGVEFGEEGLEAYTEIKIVNAAA